MPLKASEVVLQIPGTIAHGMGVLAEDIGLPHLVLFKVGIDFLDGRVHAAVEIQVILVDVLPLRREGCPLIVGEPGGIVLSGPAQRLVEIPAHARFVAHGPDHDAGTVLVPHHAALNAIQYGFAIFRILRQDVVVLFGVIALLEQHAVALHIGLRHQIEAILVAHAGKQRRIGIVTGANGVDVVLLHQHQILEHLLLAHCAAKDRIAVMAVHAAELDGLAIELHHAVLHMDLPQADVFTDGFAIVAQHQRIQIGIF